MSADQVVDDSFERVGGFDLTGLAATPVTGLIFDMDGTMVDNMHVHNEAWKVWHSRRGLPFDGASFFAATAGRSNREVVRLVMPDAPEEGLDALGADKEAVYRELYDGQQSALPGLLDLIAACEAHGRPMAVATAAPPQNAALILDGLDLRRHFVTVVSPSMGYRGKPHPDLFLAAAAAMKVPPEQCVVFEDAPLGIEAARRAGMRAVGVTTMLSADELQAPNVVFSVGDFTDARLKELLRL